jgi:hypothetical protein
MPVSQSEIEDIFGIPKQNRSIQDDDDEDVASGDAKAEASVPFTEKAAEVSKAIADVGSASPSTAENTPTSKPAQPKTVGGMFDDLFEEDTKPKAKVVEPPPPTPQVLPEATAPTPEPKPEPKPESKPEPKVEIKTPLPEVPKQAKVVAEDKKPEMPIPQPKNAAEVNFEAAPVPPSAPVKNIPKPPEKKKVLAVEKADEEKDSEDDSEDENDDIDTSSNLDLDEDWAASDGWRLTSPSPKYKRFYSEKALALGDGGRSILPGGAVDFKARFKELADLSCDITVQTNDLDAIHQKMQVVQNLRERCKQIQVHTTQQYYLWERYIDLFHGVLTRIEYARGKQEGLNFEHMVDMEHYFCSLKSLHRGADQVMKTLDGAFECLSRQVTIALPMKDIDRHGSATSAPRQITPEQRKYDALGTSSSSSKPAAKSGIVPFI